MYTSLASDWNVEPEAFAINLHVEEFEAFSARPEIIGFLGSIEIGVQRLEETAEKMPLILLCDSNPKVLGLDLNPLPLLL
jgi:hypothetical protein